MTTLTVRKANGSTIEPYYFEDALQFTDRMRNFARQQKITITFVSFTGAEEIYEGEREDAVTNWSKMINDMGIARWESNNRVPPRDILEALVKFDIIPAEMLEDSLNVSDTEHAAFISDYIKAQESRTINAEERFEMRAAFGPGAEVVNVITGRTVTV